MTFVPIPHLVPLGLGLAWATISDLRRRRIPNSVSVAILIVGLLVRALDGGASAPLSGLAGFALVLAALYVPWRSGWLKGGDVKLAAAVAAWVGLSGLIWFVLATAVAGGLVSAACYLLTPAPVRAEIRANLTLAMLQGDLSAPQAPRAGRVTVPYAVAITAGAAVAFFI